MSGPPFSRTPDGVAIVVRVTPRAARTALIGVQPQADGTNALAVRLAAPPVDGKANAALIAWLAEQLQVPRSAINISSGESSRLKRVSVAGAPSTLAERLERLLA